MYCNIEKMGRAMSRKDISEVSDTFIQNYAQKYFFYLKEKLPKKF